MSESPWQNEGVLRYYYSLRDMTQQQVADELGCSKATIANWLSKHDINTGHSSGWAEPRLTSAVGGEDDGYEYIRYTPVGEDHKVLAHRLLMAVEHDLDELRGKDVHHKNEIPWDNRLENLELMTKSEHAAHHRPVEERWSES